MYVVIIMTIRYSRKCIFNDLDLNNYILVIFLLDRPQEHNEHSIEFYEDICNNPLTFLS